MSIDTDVNAASLEHTAHVLPWMSDAATCLGTDPTAAAAHTTPMRRRFDTMSFVRT